MLDGLRFPGKIFIWSLIFNKRLMKNPTEPAVETDVKPAGASTVHTGRASCGLCLATDIEPEVHDIAIPSPHILSFPFRIFPASGQSGLRAEFS